MSKKAWWQFDDGAPEEPERPAAICYCTVCGTVARPVFHRAGSKGKTTLMKLFVDYSEASILEQQIAANSKWQCPKCKSSAIIPVDAPAVPNHVRAKHGFGDPEPAFDDEAAAIELGGAVASDEPQRFKIVGVDRESKMDTTWYCVAASEANARVKAELEGIIVTEVLLDLE